jgi:hypothetical protein
MSDRIIGARGSRKGIPKDLREARCMRRAESPIITPNSPKELANIMRMNLSNLTRDKRCRLVRYLEILMQTNK